MSESVLETFGLQNATMVYYFCLVFCWMLSVSKTCKGHIVYSLKKDWHNPKLLESYPDEVIRSKFKKIHLKARPDFPLGMAERKIPR